MLIRLPRYVLIHFLITSVAEFSSLREKNLFFSKNKPFFYFSDRLSITNEKEVFKMGKTLMTSYDERVNNMKREIRSYFENRSKLEQEIDQLKVEHEQVRQMKKHAEQIITKGKELAETNCSVDFQQNQENTAALISSMISIHDNTLSRLEKEFSEKETIIKQDEKIRQPFVEGSIQTMIIDYLNLDEKGIEFLLELTRVYEERPVFTILFHALASHKNVDFLKHVMDSLNREVEDRDLFYLLTKRAIICCEEI